MTDGPRANQGARKKRAFALLAFFLLGCARGGAAAPAGQAASVAITPTLTGAPSGQLSSMPLAVSDPLAPTRPRPYEALRPEIAKLSIPPARTSSRGLTLVERPIVLDFRHQSVTLGYRAQHVDFPEPAPAPGFPNLVFETRARYREEFLDYRRRIFEDCELGVDIPYLGLQEARPTRILPPATALTFVEDERSASGVGDVTVSLARGWNRPGLSRRLGLAVKLDTGSTDLPDAKTLPLGTGQKDFTLSYGVKQTRGSFAITGLAGLELREDGTVPTFSGASVLYGPGNQAFLSVRGDKRIEDWWTASLAITALASERDSLGGLELPGTSRQLVTITPIVTYQASEVFEVIGDVSYSPVAHHVPDAPVFEVALRWRH